MQILSPSPFFLLSALPWLQLERTDPYLNFQLSYLGGLLALCKAKSKICEGRESEDIFPVVFVVMF